MPKRTWVDFRNIANPFIAQRLCYELYYVASLNRFNTALLGLLRGGQKFNRLLVALAQRTATILGENQI